ncbi:MAG: VCBS repeat-containing protein [Chloroflexi bacterium]|nr:VCBS repeat-containing protein [Chloroflexota bacterium]
MTLVRRSTVLAFSILATVLSLIFFQNQLAQSADSIPFQATTIDALNSGDTKAVADIDMDGDADGILGGAVPGRSLVWYESGANYAMHVIRANPVYIEFTTDMQAVDLDGDSDYDIVVGDGGDVNNVLWFENPLRNTPSGVGSDPKVGANWLHHAIGSHGLWAHDIEVGDLNNDGRMDVVTSGNGHSHLWIQVTPYQWTNRTMTAQVPFGISLGDIDRDGDLDMALPFGWLRNPGDPLTGTWDLFPIVGAVGQEVVLGDLNGDGRLDLAPMDPHARAEFAWYEAPADPTSANWTRRVIDPAMGAHHPELADFNNDGNLDILMGLELEDLSIYINNGGAAPTFTKQQIDTVAAHNARFGDLNGDGRMDIFGADWIGHPPVKVYINQGDFGTAQISASVQLQGRSAAPNLALAIPLLLHITPIGSSRPLVHRLVSTNSSGQFQIQELPTGAYRVWLKGIHTLGFTQTVNLVAGNNVISLGALPEGDVNNNNQVNIVDFSLLAATFGLSGGMAGFDARADFNLDSVVNISDFSLLSSSFGSSGAPM